MSGLVPPVARRLFTAVAALALLVTASGCLRLDLGLQVRPDDTVGGTFTAAWSEQFLQEADDQDLDRSQLDAFLDALLEGIPGAERTAYDEGGYVGQTAAFTDRPLADFAEFGGDEWGYLRIDHTGRQYELDGHWDLRSAGFLDPGVFEDAEILISVNFPARVTEHNGVLDGRTVTWTMRPGDEYDLAAVAVENDGTALLIAGAASTVAVCGLLWLWQWSRLRRYSLGDDPA